MDLSVVSQNFSALAIVIAGVFFLSTLFQVSYLLQLFSRFIKYKPDQVQDPACPPVTVVVCAKDEEENIPKFLPLILEQDYPDFEVIVVNDCSSDDTGLILENFEGRYTNLRVITIKQEGLHNPGKKYPLTLGIKGAKHEMVLLTDADCYPRSKNWIRMMARHFKPGESELILGYGAYKKEAGFLNKLIRFDTFFIAMQYFSFALAGNPYMGVGRNLSYSRALFFRNKGFATHHHIPSGDDDLFVNRVGRQTRASIEPSPEAHTVSNPKKSLKAWVRQKKRHLSTGRYYRTSHKILLSGYYGSLGVMTLAFIACLIFGFFIVPATTVFLLYLLIKFVIFKKGLKKLDENGLLYIFPILEYILLAIYPLLSLTSAFSKKSRWN